MFIGGMTGGVSPDSLQAALKWGGSRLSLRTAACSNSANRILFLPSLHVFISAYALEYCRPETDESLSKDSDESASSLSMCARMKNPQS
jgi:hypothetical protein